MKIAELKQKICIEVDGLDKSTLEDIYGLIQNRLHEKDDIEEWDHLSLEFQISLKEAIADVKAGNGIPHETIMSTYRKKYAL
jgi:hypothetical protein